MFVFVLGLLAFECFCDVSSISDPELDLPLPGDRRGSVAAEPILRGNLD